MLNVDGYDSHQRKLLKVLDNYLLRVERDLRSESLRTAQTTHFPTLSMTVLYLFFLNLLHLCLLAASRLAACLPTPRKPVGGGALPPSCACAVDPPLLPCSACERPPPPQLLAQAGPSATVSPCFLRPPISPGSPLVPSFDLGHVSKAEAQGLAERWV